MSLFKKLIVAIMILLIMKGTTLLLDNYSPATLSLHRLFFFCMQVLTLVWMMTMMLLHLLKSERTRLARYLPGILFIVILLGDAAYYQLMLHPRHIPFFAVTPFSDFYTHYQRNILQYEPCTAYDSSLFYRMNPGSVFLFGNIEYDNKYSVNKKAYRDDERSLNKPSVICIGDSYTLGWGVENEQAFPQLLSRNTGMNVLNGAIRHLVPFVNSNSCPRWIHRRWTTWLYSTAEMTMAKTVHTCKMQASCPYHRPPNMNSRGHDTGGPKNISRENIL